MILLKSEQAKLRSKSNSALTELSDDGASGNSDTFNLTSITMAGQLKIDLSDHQNKSIEEQIYDRWGADAVDVIGS